MRGPANPAGRPGRRPRLPLGGGPRSKFYLLFSRGTLPPQPWPWGGVRGRVLGRAAPLPSGLLSVSSPRPALQLFLPPGRWVLISPGSAAAFLSSAPDSAVDLLPRPVGVQVKWRPIGVHENSSSDLSVSTFNFPLWTSRTCSPPTHLFKTSIVQGVLSYPLQRVLQSPGLNFSSILLDFAKCC